MRSDRSTFCDIVLEPLFFFAHARSIHGEQLDREDNLRSVLGDQLNLTKDKLGEEEVAEVRQKWGSRTQTVKRGSS